MWRTGWNVHLLRDLGALALLLVERVDSLLFLLDQLRLHAAQPHSVSVRVSLGSCSMCSVCRRTFSIANSSSALTLISLAFSSASCLINATCNTQRNQTASGIHASRRVRLCLHWTWRRCTNHLVHLGKHLIVVEWAARHRDFSSWSSRSRMKGLGEQRVSKGERRRQQQLFGGGIRGGAA